MGLILFLILLILTACNTTYKVKNQQSSFNFVKADLQKEKCNFDKVDFQQREDGVLIDKSNFTKLATNIQNFQICYNSLFDRSKSSLEYYEELLKIHGGNLLS